MATLPSMTIDVDRVIDQISKTSLAQSTPVAAQMNRWLTECEFQLGCGRVRENCLVFVTMPIVRAGESPHAGSDISSPAHPGNLFCLSVFFGHQRTSIATCLQR